MARAEAYDVVVLGTGAAGPIAAAGALSIGVAP